MKYAEINKLYTEAIANYLKQGYVINTSTQSGTYSNEIAHCDLTSGDDLVRVVLMNFYDEDFLPSAAGISLQVLVMRLDRPTLKDFKPNQKHGAYDLWNENSIVVDRKDWYCIRRESEICVNGEYKGYSDGWWVSKEEFEKQQETAKIRREKNLHLRESVNPILRDPRVYKIVLKFIKRQPRCKTVKLADIERIQKFSEREYGKYVIHAKGKRFTLGKGIGIGLISKI